MRPVDTSLERTLPFGSNPALRRKFKIVDKDIPGNIRWGRLLEELDKLAEDVALKYVRRTEPDARVVTAAVDDIALHIPAKINEDVYLRARINYVGRSSMEVGIRVDQDKKAEHSLAACYFTMVARLGEGDEAQSLPVPQLEYESELEKERYEAAIERRKLYREQMDAIGEPPSKEEFWHLQELHQAQEEDDFDGLLAGNLVRSNMERMYPDNENVPKKIFGGYVIRRAFELSLMHAEEIAPNRPVFVRVNRINFLQPIRIGDKLDYTSRIVYTGESSISIEIDIERTSLDKVTKALSNTCIFTFVNVDEGMNPQPVPQIYPTTYAEDERYLNAYRRHKKHRQMNSGKNEG
ncbi:MAG TPA: hotdog domain-containing protein [Balneolaceae bacterium]|nr:hotdog domain-containing protein [Balneolaceae bacterium]